MYTRNWSLQPLSQDYDLASRTTYAVCVNFNYEIYGGTYNLKPIPNIRFLLKRIFKAILYLLSQFSPEFWWHEVTEDIFFSYFVLFEFSDLRFEPRARV